MIPVTPTLWIDENELHFTASRSAGPGGQHVNKVSSRVTLWFDVSASPSLTLEQKQRILAKLAGRIGKDGMLRVVSQDSRSQAANRSAAVERFSRLLAAALAEAPFRIKTKLSLKAKERRLVDKSLHAAKKRLRRHVHDADE